MWGRGQRGVRRSGLRAYVSVGWAATRCVRETVHDAMHVLHAHDAHAPGLAFMPATASSKPGMTCPEPSLKRRKSLFSPVKAPPLAWPGHTHVAAAAGSACCAARQGCLLVQGRAASHGCACDGLHDMRRAIVISLLHAALQKPVAAIGRVCVGGGGAAA